MLQQSLVIRVYQFFIIIGLCCLCLLGARAETNTEFSESSNKKKSIGKKLSVCYESWKPYFYRDTKGQHIGVGVELLQIAARQAGFVIEFDQYPYNRCVKMVEDGKRDIILGVSPDPGFEESKVIVAYWILSFVVHQSFPRDTFTKLDDFKNNSFLLVAGYDYPEPIKNWLYNKNTFAMPVFANDSKEEDLRPFQMLERHRADIYIEDFYWSHEMVTNNKLPMKILSPPIFIEATKIGYRAGLSNVKKMFDQTLLNMMPENRDKIFVKYTGLTEAQLVAIAGPAIH